MTFLELVQALNREIDWSEADPITVRNLSGNPASLPRWVSQSYVELQNRQDWRWLRHEWSLDLLPSGADGSAIDRGDAGFQGRYAFGDVTDLATGQPISRFRRWVRDQESPVRVRPVSGPRNVVDGDMIWLPWDDYRYLSQNYEPAATPGYLSVDPQDRLCFMPEPNEAGHRASGEYIRGSQVLVDDADVPEMPTDYHMLIVYLALRRFAFSRAATEALAEAEEFISLTMADLLRMQTPTLDVGPALA